MAIKTFNVDEEVYSQFSRFCKEHGISMSRQIQLFMEAQVEDEPEAKEAYLRKLERLRKGRFIRVKSFAERYGLPE